ncbi:MAG: PQQ-binding-like beta-propeller repeat protein [Bacteroidales bacterium]
MADFLNGKLMRAILVAGLFFAGFPATAQAHRSDPVEIINGTFLGNWERNYYGDDAPDTLGLVWKHYLGKGITVIGRKTGSREWAGAGWTGQPLMVREGDELFLIQGANDHNLKKIRAETGELVWQYKFDDVIKGTGTLWFNASDTSLAKRWIILQGSRLGTHHFLDADKVYSYRAISYMTGGELWRHNVKHTQSYSRDVDASAIVHNDTAYIGLENSLFTIFNPDPDSAFTLGDYRHPYVYDQHFLYKPEDVKKHNYNVVTEASPAMIGRMIYIASGSGHVWGYDMDKNELVWDFYIGSDIDGSPVVTYDSCLLIAVEKQYIDGPGGILKLDPSMPPDQAVVWYFPVEDVDFVSWKGGIIGSVAVSDHYNDRHLAACIAIDGKLYVIRQDKLSGEKVIGFDGKTVYPSPELVYSYETGASISTPLFTENRLVACGYEGIYLFSYSEENEFKLLDKRPYVVESTPFIYDKRIYIASKNGFLYCLGK